nr:MAG TPA: Dec protein, OB-Fold, Decoration, VIRAL PROTEIN [Caudoviricetes sp.]
MADFQGKYNGEQIEQLLDKANDIDLSKYALKTDNAPTATKLQAARTIALSGAVTGSVSSDFGSNVTISTTLANFDASKIASGTISIDRLPKAALERLIVVADDTARFALTTATAQSGDTVKVTSTGKMYLIKDESKLSSEDGYEPYTASQASSVPWSGVTGKPSTFTPPTSSATVLGGIKVGYTTSGKNYKVQLDSSGNAYVNVPWTDNNTTYNEATADTLGLVKIGYASNGKNYAVLLANGKMYVNVPWTDNNTTYTQATSDKLGLVKIGYSATGKNYPVVLDGSGKMYVNVPWTDTNTTYTNMGAASASAAGKAGLVPAPAAGAQGKYLRGDGTWQTPPNTTYAKANTSTLGLVMIGYAENGKNYPVELDGSGKMFVNVPWTDTNTTYGVVGANGSTGLVKNGSTVTSASGYTACPIVSGVPYYKDTNTTYANMKAATASAAGAAGLVPAPAAGKQTSFLRGDGTWVVPTNTTYGLASTTANGLLRQLNGSTSSFMRGDGTWATPPNTTYAVANESTNGLMAAADKKTVNRLIGVNTVTTLANLPISKRSITATLSAATTLSVASGMQIGEELMIRCVPSAVFTQAIPNSGAYVSMSGTSITTTANKPFEINIWCYASGKYSIAVKEQD